MAMKFIKLFYDNLEVINDLEDSQAGKLFKAIYYYHMGMKDKLEEVLQDKIIKIIFNPMQHQFQRNAEAYDGICERNRQIALKREADKRDAKARACTSVHERDQAFTNVHVTAPESTTEHVAAPKSTKNKNKNKNNILNPPIVPLEGGVSERNMFKLDDILIEVRNHHQSWIEVFCMNNQLSLAGFNIWTDTFVRQLLSDGETEKSIDDFKHHFSRWFNIQKKHQDGNSKSTYATKQEQRTQQREERNATRMARIYALANEQTEPASQGDYTTPTEVPHSTPHDASIPTECGEYPFG